jgi:hypothetical protein
MIGSLKIGRRGVNDYTEAGRENRRGNRRGILRLADVVVTIGGVCCRERVQADVKWEMSDYRTQGFLYCIGEK